MEADARATDLAALLRKYREFARDIPEQGGYIYAAICDQLASDPQRAGITLRAAPAFRNPLILLAAVHHLLLTGQPHALGAYYPTIAGSAARPIDDGLYPAFAAFLDEHRPAVGELIATRTTQTNEAGRSVVSLPALGLVARNAGTRLALLEVGASAGLNLLPDRFGFRIGDVPCGDPASPLQLACEAVGELAPPVPARVPEIVWRIGLDLNPLDVSDPATRAWLRALVWPEHLDRMGTLDAALAVARRDPPLVVRGDLAADLPAVAAEAPRDAALVDALTDLASDRGSATWLVAGEAQSVLATLAPGIVAAPKEGYGPSTLSLHRFDPDGSLSQTLLAECHAHGRWLRWLDPATAAHA